MAFMVWNDQLSVENEVLDRDHRQIVALINELYEAILAGHGKDVVAGIVERLAELASAHFNREEAIFSATEYPDVDTHKQEHNAMRIWIADLRERIHEGTAIAPSLEVMNYLKDWLFEHQVGSDHKYIPYLTTVDSSKPKKVLLVLD